MVKKVFLQNSKLYNLLCCSKKLVGDSRAFLLVSAVIGLLTGMSADIKAAEIEAVLDSNNGTSSFIVQDSDTVQVMGINSDGDIIVVDSAATVDPWMGLGAAAGRLEFDDQITDEINFLNCNIGIGTTSSVPVKFLSSS